MQCGEGRSSNSFPNSANSAKVRKTRSGRSFESVGWVLGQLQSKRPANFESTRSDEIYPAHFPLLNRTSRVSQPPSRVYRMRYFAPVWNTTRANILTLGECTLRKEGTARRAAPSRLFASESLHLARKSRVYFGGRYLPVSRAKSLKRSRMGISRSSARLALH